MAMETFRPLNTAPHEKKGKLGQDDMAFLLGEFLMQIVLLWYQIQHRVRLTSTMSKSQFQQRTAH